MPDTTWYHAIFERYGQQKPKTLAKRLAKIVVALILLQLNSTLHYGLFYRLPIDYSGMAFSRPISQASNAPVDGLGDVFGDSSSCPVFA